DNLTKAVKVEQEICTNADPDGVQLLNFGEDDQMVSDWCSWAAAQLHQSIDTAGVAGGHDSWQAVRPQSPQAVKDFLHQFARHQRVRVGGLRLFRQGERKTRTSATFAGCDVADGHLDRGHDGPVGRGADRARADPAGGAQHPSVAELRRAAPLPGNLPLADRAGGEDRRRPARRQGQCCGVASACAKSWMRSVADVRVHRMGVGGQPPADHCAPPSQCTAQQQIAIVKQFQFASALQRMCVIVRSPQQPNFEVFCKGSPEKILSLCRPQSVPMEIHAKLREHTAQGYRVIGLATKQVGMDWGGVAHQPRDALEAELTFLGLLVLENRLKPQTARVIQTLKQAQLKVVMITDGGDGGARLPHHRPQLDGGGNRGAAPHQAGAAHCGLSRDGHAHRPPSLPGRGEGRRPEVLRHHGAGVRHRCQAFPRADGEADGVGRGLRPHDRRPEAARGRAAEESGLLRRWVDPKKFPLSCHKLRMQCNKGETLRQHWSVANFQLRPCQCGPVRGARQPKARGTERATADGAASTHPTRTPLVGSVARFRPPTMQHRAGLRFFDVRRWGQRLRSPEGGARRHLAVGGGKQRRLPVHVPGGEHLVRPPGDPGGARRPGHLLRRLPDDALLQPDRVHLRHHPLRHRLEPQLFSVPLHRHLPDFELRGHVRAHARPHAIGPPAAPHQPPELRAHLLDGALHAIGCRRADLLLPLHPDVRLVRALPVRPKRRRHRRLHPLLRELRGLLHLHVPVRHDGSDVFQGQALSAPDLDQSRLPGVPGGDDGRVRLPDLEPRPVAGRGNGAGNAAPHGRPLDVPLCGSCHFSALLLCAVLPSGSAAGAAGNALGQRRQTPQESAGKWRPKPRIHHAG
ncbi:hypothetical protein D910_08129, partial [Dendroctonus ponderosae]